MSKNIVSIHTPTAHPDLRRRRLMLGVPGALALGSPLMLLGCGGGGDGEADPGPQLLPMTGAPSFTRQVAAARVALPSGVPSTGLVLTTGTSLARVRDDGGTAIVTYDDGFTLAHLLTQSGEVLALALLGPEGGEIGARSTAQALVYLACAPAQLGERWQTALRQVLSQHDVVLPVVAAVEAAMRRGRLDAGDSALVAAVATAAAAFRGPPATTTGRARPLRLRYELEERSGLRVIEQAPFNSIALENNYRRRVKARVERWAYTPSGADPSARVELTPPVVVGTFDVDPEDALNLSNAVIGAFDATVASLLQELSLLGDYERGALPWTAKLSGSFELPVEPDDAQISHYRVVVIGPGAGAPARAMTAQEAEIHEQLLITTLLRDLFVPLVNTLLLPIAGESAKKALAGKNAQLLLLAVGVDLYKMATALEFFPRTIAALRAGDWGEALVAAAAELAGTDPGKSLLESMLTNIVNRANPSEAVATIVDARGNAVGIDLLSTEGQVVLRRFTAALGRINALLSGIDSAMQVADVAAQAVDITRARRLDVFDIEGSPAEVTVTPAEAVLLPTGDSQRFEVTSIDGKPLQSDYLFEWSCASKHGIVTVGGQQTTQAQPTLLPAPSASALYVVSGGDGGEEEQVRVRVLTAQRRLVGRAVAKVKLDTKVVATLSPASVEFEPGSAREQRFTLTLDPPPADPTLVNYEWICPSAHGTLQSGGVTTSAAEPRVLSGQPNATYRLAAGTLGGESETLRVEVFQRSVDPTTGETSRRKISEASAAVSVKGEFTLGLTQGSAIELPVDTSIDVTAFVKEALPAGATVAWTWSSSGLGSVVARPGDGTTPFGSAEFTSGSVDSRAEVTVRATVSLPAAGGRPARTVPSQPATLSVRTRAGLRTITFEAQAGIFACTDPRACGVSAYTAYIVPRMAKAVEYRAVFSGFGFNGCNRTLVWTGPKGDGGGCSFPITYHPHNSAGPTNLWAVWIGFGGGLPEGKCVVTITLRP